jgi:phenylpropionate dioxygenase-like ring-hydroxylating dioxygenase large terminal subunit
MWNQVQQFLVIQPSRLVFVDIRIRIVKSKLSPNYYLSSEIFQLERTRIFRKLWQFAGLKTSLAERGAFMTRTMAGLPVLLQNCAGEIKAFENLCPHRQMPLQKEAFGQARMVCPYHGWVFDDEGRVKTIPNEKTLYSYTNLERDSLCLRRYAVKVIGNLVFINLANEPISLEQQFSVNFQEALAEVSEYFAEQSVHVNLPVAYNWKLNAENVLDANHIPYIHPKTFQPLLHQVEVKAQRPPLEDSSVASHLSNDLQSQSGYNATPMRIDSWPWHSLVSRYGNENFFHTFSIFPNINFISPGGYSFIVQQFEPIAPEQTELRMTLTIAKPKARLVGLPALLRTYLKGEVAVVTEDIAYLEALQAHLYDGAPRAQHGKYESRLQSAVEVYLQLLGNKT